MQICDKLHNAADCQTVTCLLVFIYITTPAEICFKELARIKHYFTYTIYGVIRAEF